MDLYEKYLDELHAKYPDAGLVTPSAEMTAPVTCSVGRSPVSSRPAHYHEQLEVIYVLKSSSEITVNKSTYRLSAGDLCLIFPGEVHKGVFQKDCEYARLCIDTSFLFTSVFSLEDLQKNLPVLLPYIDRARVIRSSEAEGSQITELIRNVLHEYADNDIFSLLAIRTYLSQIALIIFRKCHDLSVNGKDAVQSQDTERLRPVLRKIEKNYADCLTAEDMASLAGMSYSYFSRYFKRVMGSTFSDYLNSYRITQSLSLLENSDLSVTEIALRVGFSTPSYYIAQFKKKLHATPKKYKTGLA